YQAPVWPFKAKTKAGNYNAWLDWLHAQGVHYDILLQMDTDHVPQPGYLMAMLRPFADPAVAYVAAPPLPVAIAANHGSSPHATRWKRRCTGRCRWDTTAATHR